MADLANSGEKSPRWVVHCPECGHEVLHTSVTEFARGTGSRDPFASPPKPKIPEDGVQLDCPNCSKPSTYRSFDLRYRKD